MPDEALSELPAGDATLTRLVKKMSGERGTPFIPKTHWNGYGRQVYGYTCAADVVVEARQVLAAKAEAKRARKDSKTRREEEAQKRALANGRKDYEERWADLTRLHGWTQPVPPAGSYRAGPDLLDEPTLDLYTAEEWGRLGYRVIGEPASLLIKAGNPARLYDRFRVTVTGATSNLPAKQLWLLWRRQYPTDLLAVTKALQAANKLVKIVPNGRETSRELYPLKDTFIRRWLSPHLVSGRVSREETRSCWGCQFRREPGCERCDYTGIYESHTLYEHHFVVDGHAVCFHAYQRPAKLDTTPGANLRQFGVRWTLAEIPLLRLSELLRLLRYATQNVLERAAKVSRPEESSEQVVAPKGATAIDAA